MGTSDGPQQGTSPVSLPNIRQIARTQQVREQIEAAIERGDYGPGDRLPSERELGEVLGVSRVSVREAIRSLEALGLVEVHHGRGCFVTRGPGDEYATSFVHWLAVHKEEVVDLLKVRGALDALAAESAAVRADAGTAARLAALNGEFEAAQRSGERDVEELTRLDKAFHNAVADASGSPLLATLLKELREHIDRAGPVLLSDEERGRASVREHQAIVDGISARDPGVARHAAARHIENVCAYASRLGNPAPARD